MSIVLRPYQEELIQQVKQAFKKKVRGVLIQSVTGSGKTALAASLVHRTISRGNTVWFLVHRRELIKQSMKAFDKEGIPYGVIASGFSPNAREPVQIASIGTLIKRHHRYKPPRIVIFDECHHWGSESWRRLYNWFPAETKIVGLSATPARSDGQGMGEFCEVMLTGPQPKQLIADGYLSPFRLLQPEPIDMSGVHIRMGEYDKKERDAAASKPRVVGDMISHYKQYAEGGRNLIFATSIKTSLDYVRKFTEEGYPAIHLDGETDDYLRDKALEDFDAGKILIVSNVGLFSEGMDCPALDCVTLGCPTKSIIQYLQQVGRALRPVYAEGADLSTATSRCQAIEDSEKPHAIILDHAGNSHHFGQPDEDREWSLEGRALRKKTNTVLAPRICGKCFAQNPAWRTACELCGTEFNRQGREIERVDGTLTDANKAAIERFQRIKQRKAQIERASTRDELIQVARERGYRYPEKFADYNLHVRARRARVA